MANYVTTITSNNISVDVSNPTIALNLANTPQVTNISVSPISVTVDSVQVTNEFNTTITNTGIYEISLGLSNPAIALTLDSEVQNTTISVPPITLWVTDPRISIIESTLSGVVTKVNSLETLLSTTTINVLNNTITTIDTWNLSQYRSVKYLIQITQGINYQISEILVLHNGSTVNFSEYGVIESGPTLGIFSTDISSGLIRLRLTLTNNSAATIKFVKTSIVI